MARRPPVLVTSAAGIAAVLLHAGLAVAGPLYVSRPGGLRGDPTLRSALSLYWNPAGLAAEPGFGVSLHVMGVARQASYDRVAALNDVTPEEEAANAGKAEVSTLGAVPALAARYGLSLGDFDLGFGAGFVVAAAGSVAWPKTHDAPAEHPGAVDGPQRWAIINTRFLVHGLTAGAGVRHRPSGLSAGVAPMLGIAELATLRARNADKSDDLLDAGGRLKEGRIFLEADAMGFFLTSGLRWDASPDLAFAATWHHAPKLTYKGTANIQFGTAPETTEKSQIPLPLADVFRLSASVGVTDWLTLRPTAEYSTWSDMDRQVAVAQDDGATLLIIERDFDDTWAGKLRADFHLTETLDLHGAFGYEVGATPSKTHEPGLAEADSFEAGAGATLALGEHVLVSVGFQWLQFFDRTVKDSIQTPSTNGDYTDQRQMLMVDLEVR